MQFQTEKYNKVFRSKKSEKYNKRSPNKEYNNYIKTHYHLHDDNIISNIEYNLYFKEFLPDIIYKKDGVIKYDAKNIVPLSEFADFNIYVINQLVYLINKLYSNGFYIKHCSFDNIYINKKNLKIYIIDTSQIYKIVYNIEYLTSAFSIYLELEHHSKVKEDLKKMFIDLTKMHNQ